MPEVRPPGDAVIDIRRVQRRTVGVLAAGQVLGSIAFGATVSLGALLAVDLSGAEELSGLATASVTLGAALFALPLARMAAARGRRFSLTLGNLAGLIGIAIVLTAASVRSFPLLLVGVVLIGAGNAGNLQSRFAATDLSEPQHRGRDLGTVVWATTVGGVLGPLLLGPGEVVGQFLGMPPLTGSYVFSIVAQSLAFVLYLIALRPDPLRLAQRREQERARTPGQSALVEVDHPVAARYAIFAVAGSHVVMVSVMAMTPVHLSHLAPEHVTSIVGITIAAHVFGMYGMSPLFGALADRWGRVQTILLGQVLLAASLVLAAAAPGSPAAVMVALFLLGVGWSAGTVAGAALLTECTRSAIRPRRQGLSDTIMAACAAVGAVAAGVVLGWVGYGGLALSALVFVAAVVALSPYARIPRV
ncbi:MFS transporter [Microbacterium sp.]|uniref:MFS transporter n=1 Tax=Microbacterium sp. TaxID=51671 RepID=UPI003A84FDCC